MLVDDPAGRCLSHADVDSIHSSRDPIITYIYSISSPISAVTLKHKQHPRTVNQLPNHTYPSSRRPPRNVSTRLQGPRRPRHWRRQRYRESVSMTRQSEGGEGSDITLDIHSHHSDPSLSHSTDTHNSTPVEVQKSSLMMSLLKLPRQ